MGTLFMSMVASQPVSDVPVTAVVVMGVSGCGKSSVGALLADRLGAAFIEGDSFHPPSNVAKMSAGIPLEDADRWPWLDLLGSRIKEACDRKETIIISCSALKKAYRDRLRNAAGGRLFFVFLDGDKTLLQQRMSARSGHFMPSSMLDSQLATLERPDHEDGVIPVSIDNALNQIVEIALNRLINAT